MYKKIGKRWFDLIVSTILLITLIPLLLLITLLIKFTLGRPVIFKHPRPGYLGKIFTLYKFRTMQEVVDSTGKLLPDAKRLTAVGNFLRKMSLDELPELINVIKGNMSLVGPRPLLIEYLKHYTPEQNRRHLTKPGITGLAQVRGRNDLTWDEKFKLDVWYVDNVSLYLDLKIILLTVLVVLKRRGVHAKGHATMPHFIKKDIL